MPNRILRESICYSETIDQLSEFGETMFYRAIVQADDYGILTANPLLVKAKLFPLKANSYVEKCEAGLIELEAAGLIVRYEVGRKPYLIFPTWQKYQRIRKSIPKNPLPEGYKIMPDGTLAASCGNSPQLAASCGLNPYPNPDPNPDPDPTPMAPLTAPREEPPIADAPAQQAPATEGISIVFPLKDGSEWTIRPDQIRRMIETYPNLDVHAELMHMRMWCENNPAQRKTKAGINRFINGWLSRSEAQRLEREAKAAPPQRQTKQQQYTQRDYTGVELGDIPEWMLETS